MKRADHSAIFLAITGSYLAIAGLTMHGTIRLVLLLIVAGGALVGVAIRQLALDTPKWVNTLPYLSMGWAALAVLPQIYRGGGPLCFALVVAGGVAYTLGALAYGFKRPQLFPRVFGYHELFHAATLVGRGAQLRRDCGCPSLEQRHCVVANELWRMGAYSDHAHRAVLKSHAPGRRSRRPQCPHDRRLDRRHMAHDREVVGRGVQEA